MISAQRHTLNTLETSKTEFCPEDFSFIAKLAYRRAGLMIPNEKAPMVFSRLSKRVKKLGLTGISAYCALLKETPDHPEHQVLISTLTTNVTSFFREDHHFQFITKNVFPKLIDVGRKGRRIRIWSAGCSTGQEPYSLAMALIEAWPDVLKSDVRILATDIDRQVLAQAQAAEYPGHIVEALGAKRSAKFLRMKDGSAPKSVNEHETYRIAPEVRKLVSVKELNLMERWPFHGQFDAIFCRNVVIYFALETQERLWPMFRDALLPGGHFFLGHSERIKKPERYDLESVGHTVFRRREDMNCPSPTPQNK